MVKPTVISTFAGCGGSSLGYKLAGFEELLAIDFDENAVETFKLNFPETPVWLRDIKDVTGNEIFKFCNIRKGELDVFDGSPPCQGFSTAGKRQVNDDRNDLFKEYIRLIDELSPKIFVMENVSGQVKGTMKGKFIEIMNQLKSLNYNVKCKLLNCANYGVPQSRQRLFYIGVRNDLNKEPVYPVPSGKMITVAEALENMPEDNEEKQYLKADSLEMWKKLDYGGFNKVHPKGHWYSQIKVNKNKICPTITKTVWYLGGSGLIHYDEPRYLKISELKRLASFPDDFKFIGKYQDQWARIGNAVMPLQMKAIAEVLKKDILEMN